MAQSICFGPGDAPLRGWLSEPTGGWRGGGIVIVAPVGYAYWTTHRTLRALAERLAAGGALVLRYDHRGTGDSGGEQTDGGLVTAWQLGVSAAAAELRNRGAVHLTLVGLQLGATLALGEADRAAADAVVAVVPVVRGRSLRREIRMMATDVPASAAGYPEDALTVAGTVFTPETLTAIEALDPLAAAPRTDEMLIIDRPGTPASAPLVDALRAAGRHVDHRTVAGLERCLDEPTEYATVPAELLQVVGGWVGHNGISTAARAATTTRPTESLRQGLLSERGWSEEVIRLGQPGLIGVLTRPDDTPRATVIWLNSGSESHVGPGRAWVEYARAMAGRGYAAVRLDWSGWGESPDLGHAPGRPYDHHTVAETVSVARALRDAFGTPVVLSGLCTGAWVALRVAETNPWLAGVIAINPQPYWQPGDRVEAHIAAETHVRRAPEIARQRRFAHLGVWSALDLIGVRAPAARQLRRLTTAGPPVVMVFAPGDDGLTYLEDRVGRSWRRARRRGRVALRVLDGIDHSMHRHWQRTALIDVVAGWLDTTIGRPTGSEWQPAVPSPPEDPPGA